MFRKIIDRFRNSKQNDNEAAAYGPAYEYCPRCYADLTQQKGYDNTLPYWNCKGCGETLINPDVPAEKGIAWICDGCGKMLNVQEGFYDGCGAWKCTECGFPNKIGKSELYRTEDEYQVSLKDPYRGLSDEAVLALSFYQDIEQLADRSDIMLVRHRETGIRFVRKLLTTYNSSVYEHLKNHPIAHMPKIEALFEGSSCLIVMEEYIAGRTVAEALEKGPLSEEESVRIAKSICVILHALHTLPVPIIHRDIKPSNIILTPEGEVYLLDMNAAKWYDPEETDDTRYMGTWHFAAPEQVGYGLTASSARSDIYAVGILLNVMLTGKYPKQQRAAGRLWDIIERCISLEAGERFTAEELIKQLDEIQR